MPYDIGPKIGIDGEAQFKSALAGIESQIKAQVTAMKTLSSEYDKNDKSADKLTKQQQLLGSTVDAHKNKIKALSAEYERQKSQLEGMEKTLEKVRKENGDNAEAVAKAENAFARQAKAVNDLESKLNGANQQMNSATREMEEITGELQKLQLEMQNSQSKAQAFGDSMQAAGSKISSVGEGISNIGGKLTAGLTVPLIAAGTAAVAAMDQVDEGLDTVMTKTGATGQTAKELQAVYNEVARTIPADFSEIGAAVGEINTRFEFTGKTLEAASEQFLKFAKVNGIDVNSAVRLVSRAMGDAGIDSSQYAQVLDMLTVASQKSGISIDTLTTNLAKYGAPMRNLGYDTQESIAIFAQWEKTGVNTETAFSGMKKAISNWAKEGKDGREEFQKTLDVIASAPDLATATTMAIEAFGTKAGPDMADAIYGGKFAIEEYVDALGNAGGAVDGTYNMIVDEVDDLQIAAQTAQVSLHDIGETIAKSVGPMAKEGADKLADLAKEFDNLSDDQKKAIIGTSAFLLALGPALKVTGEVTKGIGGLAGGIGGLVKDLGKLSAAKKAADQIGGMTDAVKKSTEGVSGFSQMLFKLASPAGAVVGVAVALGAAIAAFQLFHAQAVKKDIEDRFGSIRLSAEELEEVVTSLTTNDWTMKLDLQSDATAKIKETHQSLETARAEIEKLNWKVNVGIALSEEDKQAYINHIETYVQSAIDLVEQTAYKAQISVDAVLLPGTEAHTRVSEFSNRFYLEANQALGELGKELAQKVNDAFSDNILTDEELADINEIQSKIQVWLDKVSEREYAIALKKLQISAKGAGLSPESFSSLITDTNEALQKRLDESRGMQADVLLQLDAMLESGEINQAEYNEWKSQLEASVAANDVNLSLPSVQILIGTVESNYSDIILQKKNSYQTHLNNTLGSLTLGADWYSGLQLALNQGFATVDADAEEGMRGFMQSMSPNIDSLELLKEQFTAAGKVPPQALMDELTNAYQLEQISGAADNTMQLIAAEIASGEGAQQSVAQAIGKGNEIDGALAQALRDNYGIVWDSTTGMFQTIQEASFLSQADALSFMNASGMQQGTALADSIAAQYGLTYDATTGLWSAIGVATSENAPTQAETAKSTGAGVGAAAGVGVAEGIAGQESSVSESATNTANAAGTGIENAEAGLVEQGTETGENTGESVGTGIENVQPAVEQTATDAGTNIGTKLSEGLQSTHDTVISTAEQLAKDAAQAMQDIINAITLDPPGMDTPDWTGEAETGRAGMQTYLNNNPLYIKVNQTTGSKVSTDGAFAHGGFIEGPMFIEAGEDGREAIIPLSAKYRPEAFDLFAQVGDLIGYDNNFAADAARSMGAAKQQRQTKKDNRPNLSLHIDKGAVAIETRSQDSAAIARDVSRILGQEVERKLRGSGYRT